MSTQSATEILILRPDVVITTLEREAVLLDLESKYFYSVNPSGWAITQLFEGGASRKLAYERAAAWGARESDETVAAFIERLADEKLVTPAASASFAADVTYQGDWTAPSIDKHREPLQRVMISAFDPTLPLAE